MAMKEEDYELIAEISNSEFPLIDFVNDLRILNSRGSLLGFNYGMMQDDIVKIAKTFKYYYDKCQEGQGEDHKDSRRGNTRHQSEAAPERTGEATKQRREPPAREGNEEFHSTVREPSSVDMDAIERRKDGFEK